VILDWWDEDPLPMGNYDEWKAREPELWPTERSGLRIDPCRDCGSQELAGRKWVCTARVNHVYCRRCKAWREVHGWLEDPRQAQELRGVA
jgi:hypothetical protein